MTMSIVAARRRRREGFREVGRSSGCAAYLGHAEVRGGAAGGEFTHGLQFLRGGGQGGLDRGDLAEPALVPGLLKAIEEIGVDLLQARHLGRVNPKEGASDTGVFMRTWRSVVTAAHSESDLAQLEVGQEFVPFGGAELTVFFAGPPGPAAGDERPVVGDHVFGVDRGIAHGGVQHGMAAYLRGDVRRQPGSQGVGDEDPPEIMGPPLQRLTGDGDLSGL
jgi:hypothetical protein